MVRNGSLIISRQTMLVDLLPLARCLLKCSQWSPFTHVRWLSPLLYCYSTAAVSADTCLVKMDYGDTAAKTQCCHASSSLLILFGKGNDKWLLYILRFF